MSIESVVWVLNDAPVTNQAELVVLFGLANHASKDGTGAWPSQATLADYARCSDRTVRTHLAELERRGVIRRGDQRMVAHLDQRYRPVVWDLMVKLTRESSPEDISGLTGSGRKISEVRPEDSGSSGRKLLSAEPSFEPSVNRPLRQPDNSADGRLLASLRAEKRNPAPRCAHGLPMHHHPGCFTT